MREKRKQELTPPSLLRAERKSGGRAEIWMPVGIAVSPLKTGVFPGALQELVCYDWLLVIAGDSHAI